MFWRRFEKFEPAVIAVLFLAYFGGTAALAPTQDRQFCVNVALAHHPAHRRPRASHRRITHAPALATDLHAPATCRQPPPPPASPSRTAPRRSLPGPAGETPARRSPSKSRMSPPFSGTASCSRHHRAAATPRRSRSPTPPPSTAISIPVFVTRSRASSTSMLNASSSAELVRN